MVRTLRGFRKGQHTLPDAVNSATTAFLGKLCAAELAEEAEALFQQARALLAYKRKELSLDLGVGTAVLSAKDFVYELAYALVEADPSEYAVTRTLHGVRSADFLALPATDTLFDGRFTDVVFGLRKGAPVEQVIDAVEGLDETGLKVDYPSDCASCLLTVPDVEAEVRYDGQSLAMAFPRAAAPSVLWQDFLRLRHAFALTKETTLAGLVV